MPAKNDCHSLFTEYVEKIKQMLKSSRLRETILKIDTSQDRFRDLHKEMKDNKHFYEFASALLTEMMYRDENGHFVCPDQ